MDLQYKVRNFPLTKVQTMRLMFKTTIGWGNNDPEWKSTIKWEIWAIFKDILYLRWARGHCLLTFILLLGYSKYSLTSGLSAAEPFPRGSKWCAPSKLPPACITEFWWSLFTLICLYTCTWSLIYYLEQFPKQPQEFSHYNTLVISV